MNCQLRRGATARKYRSKYMYGLASSESICTGLDEFHYYLQRPNYRILAKTKPYVLRASRPLKINHASLTSISLREVFIGALGSTMFGAMISSCVVDVVAGFTYSQVTFLHTLLFCFALYFALHVTTRAQPTEIRYKNI